MWYKISLPLVIFFSSFTTVAYAEEFVISGNGAESTSNIQSNLTSNTTIEQNNQSNVNNTINSSADTGNNSASSNSSEVNIQTGDINNTQDIKNNLNSSVIDLCCSDNKPDTLEISNNGAGSTNNISTNQDANTTVFVSQNAIINNVISVISNTGSNIASGNNGEVNIQTGNIQVNGEIKNSVNNSFVLAPVGTAVSLITIISGNGENSKNIVSTNLNINFQVYINNLAAINNVLSSSANTGGNFASGNLGAVDIKTGDININFNINNLANSDIVAMDCCEEEIENPSNGGSAPPIGCTDNCNPPANSPNNPSNPSGGVSSGSNPASAGQVLAAAVGQILPATGSHWVMILTLASLLMFLLGLYLRLHPGQDPGALVFSSLK